MSEHRPNPPKAAAPAVDAVLPDISSDERDEGWGDEPDGRRNEQWYRRERPPHHG